jgi:hypothetical protein
MRLCELRLVWTEGIKCANQGGTSFRFGLGHRLNMAQPEVCCGDMARKLAACFS